MLGSHGASWIQSCRLKLSALRLALQTTQCLWEVRTRSAEGERAPRKRLAFMHDSGKLLSPLMDAQSSDVWDGKIIAMNFIFPPKAVAKEGPGDAERPRRSYQRSAIMSASNRHRWNRPPPVCARTRRPNEQEKAANPESDVPVWLAKGAAS